MTDWVAIVMAAGSGSRMRSSRPKVLHQVAGRPMLQCVIDAARAAGCKRQLVVLSPSSFEIQAVLPDTVAVAFQPGANGTGGAVQAAEQTAGDARHVLVMNGDLPLIQPQTLQRLQHRHEATGAVMSLLTSTAQDAAGLARVRRDAAGGLSAIVEELDASADDLLLTEINAGVYCFRTDWLWTHVRQIQPSTVTGELYLTELLRLARAEDAPVASEPAEFDEIRGVNTRAELAVAERLARERICLSLMAGGVTLIDPRTAYIDHGVQIGEDSVIGPNTTIHGATVIGSGCEIGPNALIRSSRIGDRCRVVASVVEEAELEDGVSLGPFSHLRPGASIGEGAQLGNYAEVKASRIGAGTQMHHFSYIGDATVGDGVNVGAGTITCNFDGHDKHQTHIGAGAFIGSDTMLVAPVSVGEGGRTGAGSVVTHDVAPGALVVGVPARPFAAKKPNVKDGE